MLSALTTSAKELKNQLSSEHSSSLTDPDSELAWYIVVGPKLFLFLTIFVFPFFFAIWMSLHEWHPLAAEQEFVGLENFYRLAGDGRFIDSLVNTFAYTIGVSLSVPIALFIAILLNKNIRWSEIYAAAIFVPVVVSWVVVSLIWMWIYNPDYGLLNAILSALGLPTLQWTRGVTTALPSLIIIGIWKTVGFNLVIFLAGLRGIPDSYYEAARISGANSWQRFRYITLPLLKPTTFFVVLVTLITAFREFTPMFVITEGGPVTATHTIVFYFYRTGFEYGQMGYASAMAVVLMVIVFTVSLIQQRTWGEDVDY
jgi:ABC-type sugar transport system permease subunit